MAFLDASKQFRIKLYSGRDKDSDAILSTNFILKIDPLDGAASMSLGMKSSTAFPFW